MNLKLTIFFLYLAFGVITIRGGTAETRCENNDTRRCAQLIQLGEKIDGTMDSRADRSNYFKVEIEQPGKYRIDFFKELRYPQYFIEVTDADQKSIFKQYFNDQEPIFEFVIRTKGTHYIQVFNSPGSGKLHSFDLTLSRRP
jgi:hypothetical protein